MCIHSFHDGFFLHSQRLLSTARLKPLFFLPLWYTASYIFCGVACGSFHTFFLLSCLPFPLSRLRVLIAIQEARRQSHLREVFSLRRCMLLSRIMKLESRSICGPCGAIFFNYSCRSSLREGGKQV